MSLRGLVLIIVLLVLFEPVAKLISTEKINPVNLVFIDNSASMSVKEKDFNRPETVNTLLSELQGSGLNNVYYLFGERTAVSSSPAFNDPVTDFGGMFSEISSSKQNIASVTIISDGVITQGSESFRGLNKLSVPFYTVLIGDSVRKKDIKVDRITTNDLIYAGVSSPLIVNISASGYSNTDVKVQLFEENSLIGEQPGFITGGALRVRFDYRPTSPGEKKLAARVTPLRDEAYLNNNSMAAYVNVLSGKLKVFIIGGTPSSDISAISNSLTADTNFTVKAAVHIGNGRYIPKDFSIKQLDSANILVLSGFPAGDTPQELINAVITLADKKNTPVLFITGSSTDLIRLRTLMPYLPFEITGLNSGSSEVQGSVNGADVNHPVINNLTESAGWNWSALPPVTQPSFNYKPRAGSAVLLYSSIRNVRTQVPLFSVMRLGSKRSAAFSAENLWRWKLNQPGNNILFDNFMISIIKWLNAADDKKQVKITTTKKIYSSGESVEFVAEAYNQTFEPLSGASIGLEIKDRKGNKINLTLNELENGLYEGSLLEPEASDYTFRGTVTYGNSVIGADSGRFNVGDFSAELIDPGTNPDYMNRLATQTGGRFFYNNDTGGLTELLRQKQNSSVREKTNTEEYDIWASNILLILVIVFLGIEWFLRKREGMI
ncbi:MAG: hypothetical protein HUU54_13645 [Ignavibacteriaceae bacterium]|nr:hypothetical protein [Ignavibacteriaceae bacterium]